MKTQLFPGVNRRHFLRGLGACLALPAFESLRPFGALAAAAGGVPAPATTATGMPLRSAFVYFPNGAIPGEWWPKEEGADWQPCRTLQPLAEARPQFQLLGGLDHQTAVGGVDGGGDHARANGTFLTGVRLKKSATDVRAGVSIDQVIARSVGQATRFPSLELTCDAVRKSGACDSGYACAYQFNISWSSASTPMTPEANPRLLFERLFGTGAPGERTSNLARRQAEDRSILDFVTEDARAMQRRLAAHDRSKLDQYLTGIRELETRIQSAERFGKIPDPAVPTPTGVPTEYAEYVQMMFDLAVLAFQTDSTRVLTLMLAHDGSNRSFGEIGIAEGHHDLSHHQNKAETMKKVSEIDQWYVKQFAKFLGKMEAVKEADGHSLLHNSMVVYGSGNADGNRHSHNNLPIILAGRGGGTLNPGRYQKMGGKPATNLFLSMADRMGVSKLERFGDSTARLENI